MKLRDVQFQYPFVNEWLGQGRQSFQLGVDGVESIEETKAGSIAVTITHPNKAQTRTLLFTGPGNGTSIPDEDWKRFQEHLAARKKLEAEERERAALEAVEARRKAEAAA